MPLDVSSLCYNNERVLWPGLTPYQIICKVSVKEELPDMGTLDSKVKLISKKCLTKLEERPKINVIFKLLV
jgi:hypothetical protein